MQFNACIQTCAGTMPAMPDGESDVTQEPQKLRTIIIGAGMAGLLAGIKLKERGETDFVIYEKGDTVGGTWRENTYPGLS